MSMAILWTVGHSNRRFAAFVDLLRAHGIQHLVDVRSHPSSRRHPQFDRLELEGRLPPHHVSYTWMPALGGMRVPVPGATSNAAWQEDGFRAYADHMQTETFASARQQLEHLAVRVRCAVLCAEADPLSCHRQLLADAFVAAGWQVQHLLTREEVRPHVLTSTAVVDRQGRVTYPGAPELPFGSPPGTDSRNPARRIP